MASASAVRDVLAGVQSCPLPTVAYREVPAGALQYPDRIVVGQSQGPQQRTEPPGDGLQPTRRRPSSPNTLHATRSQCVYLLRDNLLMAAKFLLALLLLALDALAGESAVLSTGVLIRVDRHELDGAKVRLYLNGGSIELPAAAVVAFEKEEAKPAPLPQPKPSPQELVHQAAERWGLPPEFVSSVAQVESGYRTDSVSPKGAFGLMQLMPSTAQLLAADPADPEQNADAGARYLRSLLEKYDGDVPRALAAYNAGPGAVDRYNGIPPYRETVQYVERVIKQYHAERKQR